MAVRIKKGDRVVVIAGRDKGKQGEVLKVLKSAKKGLRLVVEGVMRVKKHQRPNPQLNIPGGIVEQDAPIAYSNVAILNPATGKADKVAFKFVNGRKVRVFKSNDEVVDE